MRKFFPLFAHLEEKSWQILRLSSGMRPKENIFSVKCGEELLPRIIAAGKICLQPVLGSWLLINGIRLPMQSITVSAARKTEIMCSITAAHTIAAMGCGQWIGTRVSLLIGNGFNPLSMRPIGSSVFI